MTEYRIVVDDDDRADCPDKPWSATIHDVNDHMVGAGVAGLGATIAEAVTDALASNYLAGTDEENQP